MKKSIYYIRSIFAAVLCIAGVSFTFINSSTISNFLAKTLNLRITPSFVGGEIAAEFYDDAGDDAGSGILNYPSNTAFEPGCLDLIRYTVHKPVYEAKWQEYSEYWQLDLEFAAGNSETRNIVIYVDADGDKNGCMETLSEGAENILFDTNHPWDYAIWICENKSKIYDSQKNLLYAGQTSIQKEGKIVIVRIPLLDKSIQRVYSADKTYHYVCIGGYSKFDRGSYMPIDKRRSLSHGGTKNSSDYSTLIPRLYDVLGENSQLACWNKDDLIKATLIPVEASMNNPALKFSNKNFDENAKFISEIKARISNSSSDNSIMGFSTLDEAEAHYAKLVETEPENALAWAYYASCVAMRGGESNIVQAVNLVNKSFELFDKAIELATSENEYEVYMNRASVCAAVPDAVFNKAAVGAQDFMKCAALSKKLYPDQPELTAFLYIRASECFEIAQRNTEKVLAIQEAKKIMYNE